MQHCVAGYWRNCFLGKSHIISLRDSAGKPLSTLEISVAQDGSDRCEIVQHRARQNKTPVSHLRSLEGRLMALIRREADFKGLAQWREKAAKLDSLLRAAELRSISRGYDENRLTRLAAVLGSDRLSALFGAQDLSGKSAQ